jgi:hypothetical protein
MAAAPEAEAQRRGAQPAPIDLSTPQGALQAMRRIWCTQTDGEPVYWFWQGDVYSRRQGEADRLLFRVQGLNVRTCGPASNPERGQGFRSVSRELLIYLDPTTGEVLSEWTNPWTGETVDVLHVANDPVNGEFFERTRSGAPLTFNANFVEDHWFMTSTVPLFYPNPLGGAYQAEVGGTYHATEMFNFMGVTSNLTDARLNTASVEVGWVRISDWLPWMRMGGREGMLYFHTAGTKVLDWNQISPLMQNEVATHYPTYREPPPVDDARPNVTSWLYYQRVREGTETPPDRE